MFKQCGLGQPERQRQNVDEMEMRWCRAMTSYTADESILIPLIRSDLPYFSILPSGDGRHPYWSETEMVARCYSSLVCERQQPVNDNILKAAEDLHAHYDPFNTLLCSFLHNHNRVQSSIIIHSFVRSFVHLKQTRRNTHGGCTVQEVPGLIPG